MSHLLGLKLHPKFLSSTRMEFCSSYRRSCYKDERFVLSSGNVVVMLDKHFLSGSTYPNNVDAGTVNPLWPVIAVSWTDCYPMQLFEASF